jgi:hypothetical protein
MILFLKLSTHEQRVQENKNDTPYKSMSDSSYLNGLLAGSRGRGAWGKI